MKPNDWAKQTVNNKDGSLSFKTYDGRIYFTSTGQRTGGTYYPNPYLDQLKNDLALIEQDISNFQKALDKIKSFIGVDVSGAANSLATSITYFGSLKDIVIHDIFLLNTGSIQGLLGWSPYITAMYENAPMGIFINLWPGMDQYDNRGMPRPLTPSQLGSEKGWPPAPAFTILGPAPVKPVVEAPVSPVVKHRPRKKA